jgi:hypothetical protein
MLIDNLFYLLCIRKWQNTEWSVQRLSHGMKKRICAGLPIRARHFYSTGLTGLTGLFYNLRVLRALRGEHRLSKNN